MEQIHTNKPFQTFKLILPVGEHQIQVFIEDVWGGIATYKLSSLIQVI